jgi:hypothetical protein
MRVSAVFRISMMPTLSFPRLTLAAKTESRRTTTARFPRLYADCRDRPAAIPHLALGCAQHKKAIPMLNNRARTEPILVPDRFQEPNRYI